MGKFIYTINTNEAEVFLSAIGNPFLKPFQEKHPEMVIHNIIDDTLLNDTRTYGGMTPAIASRMLNYAKAAEGSGASGVLVTCTSVNDAIRAIRPLLSIPIINIAEPTAEMAVKNGTKIGVLATLPTSPEAIDKILLAEAADKGKKIELINRVAEGAFDILKTGDREKHDQMVSEALYKLSEEVDCIVFAQISMSLLKYDASRVKVPIFMIGNSGLERMLELIQ